MLQFQNAKFLASYGTFSQIPPCDSMEIAFAGRSNVGKSTLMNTRSFSESHWQESAPFREKLPPSIFTGWIR